MNFKDFLIEDWDLLTEKAKSAFKQLQANKVPLDVEENEEVKRKKAVWSDNHKAVWKSKNKNGKITYVTNTHRAYNTAPTLKGAISRFHKFIKGTA